MRKEANGIHPSGKLKKVTHAEMFPTRPISLCRQNAASSHGIRLRKNIHIRQPVATCELGQKHKPAGRIRSRQTATVSCLILVIPLCLTRNREGLAISADKQRFVRGLALRKRSEAFYSFASSAQIRIGGGFGRRSKRRLMQDSSSHGTLSPPIPGSSAVKALHA